MNETNVNTKDDIIVAEKIMPCICTIVRAKAKSEWSLE